MEREEIISKGYIIGFNHGYILAKNDPSLLSELYKKVGNNDYLKGIAAGEIQFKKEQKIEELKEQFKKNDFLNKGNGRGI
ncbi:MAG: hypothetical protein V4561_10245 [Bacteroidota bacterium]